MQFRIPHRHSVPYTMQCHVPLFARDIYTLRGSYSESGEDTIIPPKYHTTRKYLLNMSYISCIVTGLRYYLLGRVYFYQVRLYGKDLETIAWFQIVNNFLRA